MHRSRQIWLSLRRASPFVRRTYSSGMRISGDLKGVAKQYDHLRPMLARVKLTAIQYTGDESLGLRSSQIKCQPDEADLLWLQGDRVCLCVAVRHTCSPFSVLLRHDSRISSKHQQLTTRSRPTIPAIPHFIDQKANAYHHGDSDARLPSPQKLQVPLDRAAMMLA